MPTLSESTLSNHLLDGQTDLYAVATGAGAALLTSLWGTPGASAYLKGFHFPYDNAEMDAFLGFQPADGYCNEKTAILMAMEAYVRARKHHYLRGEDHDAKTANRKAIGLSLTASVASKSAHRGEHRAFAATISNITQPTAKKIVLEKGVGLMKRLDDDLAVTSCAMDQLHSIHLTVTDVSMRGVHANMPTFTEEQIKEMLFEHPYPIAASKSSFVNFPEDLVVFIPGNFNPIHKAHQEMGRKMSAIYGSKPIYTICVDPPHKQSLSLIDMLDRTAMFRALAPEAGLLFTRKDPLFIDKMQRRPDSAWAVGGDTLDRFLDPKWGPSTDDVCDVIERTGSKIFFFPCWDNDNRIDKWSIAEKYKSDKLVRLFDRNIFSVNEELPEIRSSHIRAAAGR